MKYLNHNCSAKCDYIENSCENVVWNITTQQSDEPRKISSFYSNERTDLMDPLQPKKKSRLERWGFEWGFRYESSKFELELLFWSYIFEQVPRSPGRGLIDNDLTDKLTNNLQVPQPLVEFEA